MPLDQYANKVEAPQGGKDWKRIPEDIYQVVVKDIDEKIQKKYQSEEDEAFYVFKLAILDGDGETLGQVVSAFCTRKWFSGSKKLSPSKLVNLVSAVYAFYYPNLSVVELEAEDMTPAVINDLIGKQLRITVTLNVEGTGNKVVGFMAIKKELDVPEVVKVATVAKGMLAQPTQADTVKPVVAEKEAQPAKVAAAETKEAKSDLPF